MDYNIRAKVVTILNLSGMNDLILMQNIIEEY